jgi:hypothetical protein
MDLQPDKLASLSNRMVFIVQTWEKQIKVLHMSMIKVRE